MRIPLCTCLFALLNARAAPFTFGGVSGTRRMLLSSRAATPNDDVNPTWPVPAVDNDERKPKRAPSSYILFCKETRPKLKVQNPDATFCELGSQLGQLWASMDEHAKAPYVKESEALKAIETAALVAATGETLFDFRKRALVHYRTLFGDMRIPQSFVVPPSEEWGEEFWGLKLGRVVDLIRNNGGHEDKRDELLAAGFIYDKQSTKVPAGTQHTAHEGSVRRLLWQLLLPISVCVVTCICLCVAGCVYICVCAAYIVCCMLKSLYVSFPSSISALVIICLCVRVCASAPVRFTV
jgi:hypothetical protein